MARPKKDTQSTEAKLQQVIAEHDEDGVNLSAAQAKFDASGKKKEELLHQYTAELVVMLTGDFNYENVNGLLKQKESIRTQSSDIVSLDSAQAEKQKSDIVSLRQEDKRK